MSQSPVIAATVNGELRELRKERILAATVNGELRELRKERRLVFWQPLDCSHSLW